LDSWHNLDPSTLISVCHGRSERLGQVIAMNADCYFEYATEVKLYSTDRVGGIILSDNLITPRSIWHFPFSHYISFHMAYNISVSHHVALFPPSRVANLPKKAHIERNSSVSKQIYHVPVVRLEERIPVAAPEPVRHDQADGPIR
jgi:hypothetical protein